MFTNSDFIIITICYFLGSIPCGLLISKLLRKDDPRQSGSKNIGATNMLRISGWKVGLLTLISDVAKAYIPLIVLIKSLNFSHIEEAILAIFMGHLFPVWIKFKGGKGIAVLIGSLLAYNSMYGQIYVLVWLLTALITRYSSLAALIALITTFMFILTKNDDLSFAMLFILTLVIFKHKANIARLFKGQESKIILKKEN